MVPLSLIVKFINNLFFKSLFGFAEKLKMKRITSIDILVMALTFKRMHIIIVKFVPLMHPKEFKSEVF